MPRQCKHESVLYTWTRGDGEPPFAAHCHDCGVRMSLGQSNDAPAEVQVEIRAAELEPLCNPEVAVAIMDGLRLDSIIIEQSQGEIDGADCHALHAIGMTTGGDYPVTMDAGWLARELATHHRGETRDAAAWTWDVTRPLSGQYEEQVAFIAQRDRADAKVRALEAANKRLTETIGAYRERRAGKRKPSNGDT
jgi:hypothetical protein